MLFIHVLLSLTGSLTLPNIRDHQPQSSTVLESEVGVRVQFGQHSAPRAQVPVARDLQSQILQNSEIGDCTYELRYEKVR